MATIITTAVTINISSLKTLLPIIDWFIISVIPGSPKTGTGTRGRGTGTRDRDATKKFSPKKKNDLNKNNVKKIPCVQNKILTECYRARHGHLGEKTPAN